MGIGVRHDLRSEVLEFLAAHSAMTLATCAEDIPWAAAVYYVNRDFVFYFLSDPRSRHGAQIAANPTVALTVYDEAGDWREIRGVQASGRAELLPEDGEAEEAWSLYLAKYPFVEKWHLAVARTPLVRGALGRLGGPTGEMARRIGSVRFYRVVADRVLYTDNSAGFGNRREIVMGAGA